jgi:hypothetical protein
VAFSAFSNTCGTFAVTSFAASFSWIYHICHFTNVSIFKTNFNFFSNWLALWWTLRTFWTSTTSEKHVEWISTTSTRF